MKNEHDAMMQAERSTMEENENDRVRTRNVSYV